MADREVNETMGTADGYEEPLERAIERLAGLSPLEYARVRKDEAKCLGITPIKALDNAVSAARKNGQDENDLGLFEPDPWPEEVDGDDLLNRITTALRCYVVMPPHAAEAVALWVMHCHAFELWRHTPRLGVLAPEKECGKSTLLDVLLCLAPRAIKTENLSTATMFRVVDQFRPTLLVDEFDTFLKDNEELRGALNAGHAKGGRHLRCEGDDNKVRAFRTFGPVALAGIGRLPETLADRSIIITMQKRKPDENVQDFHDDRVGRLRELASQAARWVQDHEIALREAEPTMPQGINNRRANKWRPLLSIADTAGGEWPERARQAAVALTMGAGDDAISIRAELLEDIRAVFNELGYDHLFSEEIVDRLHQMEDRLWPEYGKQRKPITKNQVARLLKPFGVAPTTIRRDQRVSKGYKLDTFEDLFARYIDPEKDDDGGYPPDRTVTPLQPAENKGSSEIQTVTLESDVTVEKSRRATDSATCNGVTDGIGGYGANTPFEGDLEEREAIQAIDGEAAICVHCGELVGLDEQHVPYAGNRKLHACCYDAHFGFERQGSP